MFEYPGRILCILEKTSANGKGEKEQKIEMGRKIQNTLKLPSELEIKNGRC